MKNNYRNNPVTIVLLIVLLVPFLMQAQNIQFTFANAQNTNDGTNDFYEADIMIQTIDGLSDFKVGSGQIYFNYNTLAFGENVDANGNFEVITTNPDYLVGQFIDAAAASIYGTQVINDNTTSRVTWAFLQTFSSSTFAANNVTATPTKLMRIKFTYIDVNELPMVAFENDNSVLSQATDQFFTACGDSVAANPFETADCTNFPGTQFVGAIFDNAEATLSDNDFELLTELSMYPNPASDIVYIKGNIIDLKQIDIFNINGQLVKTVTSNLDQIDVSSLESAVYFLKLYSNTGSKTIKLIKK